MKVVTLVDDVDGRTSKNVSTIQFGLDGHEYEIDLGHVNERKLRKALEEYTQAAHKPRGSGRPARRRQNNRHRSREIRAWAKSKGYQVQDRGRVPEAVVAKFEASH